MNGGICLESTNQYTCECSSEWAGTTCDLGKVNQSFGYDKKGRQQLIQSINVILNIVIKRLLLYIDKHLISVKIFM